MLLRIIYYTEVVICCVGIYMLSIKKGGLMSGGLMSGGLMSGGLMSGGLMSGGLKSGGLKSYDSTEMSHYHSCLAVCISTVC